MSALDHALLRTLAGWDTGGHPVTSLYLHVDGRVYPRREDVLGRLGDLLKEARKKAEELDRERRASVMGDVQRILAFVRDEFDRKGVRGLAAFSSSGAGLWEDVELSQPVPSRVEVGDRPDLIPLEAVVEASEPFCTVVADRERARLFVTNLGTVEEVSDVLGDVPGWHDQGGWSQARYQRHIKDHLQRYLRGVAEAIMRLHTKRPFRHLVLAGTEDLVAEMERELHDYVRRKVIDRVTLSITVTPEEVAAHSQELEAGLEAAREREALDRLFHEVRSETGRAVAGLPDTLSAVESGRVQTLVVEAELQATGVRCPSCGHLDASGSRCPACGAEMVEAPQLVEEVVESALRQRCRVETVAGAPSLAELGGIGALLRF